MSKFAVEIANPVPGGMRFTSRPDHFVQAGLAEMRAGKLHFYEHHQQQHVTPDRCFWNGSCRRPGAMYLPGQVRS